MLHIVSMYFLKHCCTTRRVTVFNAERSYRGYYLVFFQQDIFHGHCNSFYRRGQIGIEKVESKGNLIYYNYSGDYRDVRTLIGRGLCYILL